MSMLKTLTAAGLALAMAVGLSACGERKIQVYEAGVYKGAPTTQPWDTPQYGGQKASWERAIQERTLNQNDYWRMQNSAGAAAPAAK